MMNSSREVCRVCRTPLVLGAMGLQCMRCLFSLRTADYACEGVAEFFPELSIQEKIARGGFGTVFRAEQLRMKRQVALKVLDTGLAASREAVALFEREMVTVGALDHPGIVRAYDAGERDGRWYMVMELVDGEDCGALVRKHGTLPVAESCEIIRQSAVALHYAHSKGLVHRDVKPGNIMIAEDGMRSAESRDPALSAIRNPQSAIVKVLDFGLASLAVSPLIDNPAAVEDDSTSDHFLGTLEYVAPEQIEAPAKVDARADIYALGATLRRFLTGKPAREGRSEQTLALRMRELNSTPVGAITELRPDLPKPLAALCDRLVALDRDQRPPTASEVAELLQPWCAGAELGRLFTAGPLPEKPFVFPKKSRRLRWGVAAALVAIAGVSAFVNRPTAPGLEGSAVFSEKVSRFHAIPAENMPRLLSAEWEVEREHLSTEPLRTVSMARLRPDGRLIWRRFNATLVIEPRPGGKSEEVGNLHKLSRFGVQPETGNLVWTRNSDPDDLAIHRILHDGTRLAPLVPDFSKDAPEEARAAMKAQRLAQGDEVGCAYPWGIGFVTESNVPLDSGLRPGDVVYADEGHRDLALYDRPIFPKVATYPGLWKFRFDSDAPAQQIGRLDATWIPSASNFPVDVTVSRRGVFLLNRSDLVSRGNVIPTDYNSRVLRWDASGFQHCTTDQPILSPAGIAADPLSADLFVLDGGTVLQPGVVEQRILRLRRGGKNHYIVEIFARKFRGLSYCGIQITPDGQRMVITDERLTALVVLKRRGVEQPLGTNK